ncbi:MAG: ParE family toxin-like protein [Phycisphaerae bacterium]
MKSIIDDDFLACFQRLPDRIKRQARKNYRLWRSNPSHPSLQFKKVSTEDEIYSVRIGIGWRALGLLENNTIQWFWIGSHADYDNLLSKM